MKSAVVAESHRFLEDVLDAAKAREIRDEYEQRRLVTPAGDLVLRTDVAGAFIDDLRRWRVGPDRIHWHPNPEKFIPRSSLADHARRDRRVGGFWFGDLEAELWAELGIATTLTPKRMERFNNKIWLRDIAKLLGLEASLPFNRICFTADEVRTAEREIMFHPHNGHPIPDFPMGKIGGGLSGAGMEFFRDDAARARFYQNYINGQPLIIEAAWSAERVTVLSVHFDVHMSTIDRAGHTLNVIENGCNHCGNTVVRGRALLPGVSLAEVDRAYRMCLPFVRYMQRAHGLEGKIGFDMIRVTDVCGFSRWYIIEANAIRPPAPRYALALGETIAPRLHGTWGISMVDVEIAPGAAWTYDQIVHLMRHPRWGNIGFNGVTGVIPLLTNLLAPPRGFKQKFIAVCVGHSANESLLLLDRLRFLTGSKTLAKTESDLHRLPDWEAAASTA